MEPTKKIKIISGEDLEKLPNGLPIPLSLPPEQINSKQHQKKEESKRHRKIFRKAGKEQWLDPTLEEWDDNDFRVFVGNLASEVTDESLRNAFKKYSSISKVKVIRDKKSERTKGYGFISFLSSDECLQALKLQIKDFKNFLRNYYIMKLWVFVSI